jgi:hypothetical protein
MLNPNRWKVWANYAQIAFDNKNMKKFVKAVAKIIELDKVNLSNASASLWRTLL